MVDVINDEDVLFGDIADGEKGMSGSVEHKT